MDKRNRAKMHNKLICFTVATFTFYIYIQIYIHILCLSLLAVIFNFICVMSVVKIVSRCLTETVAGKISL